MPRSINTNPEHKTQTQNIEDKNTCPENLPTCPGLPTCPLAQKIYPLAQITHLPRKFIPNTCPENLKKKPRSGTMQYSFLLLLLIFQFKVTVSMPAANALTKLINGKLQQQ